MIGPIFSLYELITLSSASFLIFTISKVFPKKFLKMEFVSDCLI